MGDSQRTPVKWPIGIISMKRTLSEDARAQMCRQWQEAFGGPEKAPAVIILEEDMTWWPLGVPEPDRAASDGDK